MLEILKFLRTLGYEAITVTNGVTIGDSFPSAIEERRKFICAIRIGLDDLEAGRELSFDDAAIRLGLDQHKARTCSLIGKAHSSLAGE